MTINTLQPYYIHALILAAGQSKRFKSSKQLALINGQSMVSHSILIMKQATFDNISVVVGAELKEISHVIQKINTNSKKTFVITSIFAEHWQQGMGVSIAEGLKGICSKATHVFIGLVDQVEISSSQYNVMISASKKNPSKIIAAYYNQHIGAPAIFPKAYFAKLAKLDNDEGARGILRTHKNEIIAIELPEAAKDIDTQLDLQKYISNINKGTEHD